MSNIILGSKVGLSGRYRLEVRDATTHQMKRELDWFDNIITDLGLNIVHGYGTQSLAKGFIGTGTTAPAATDTQLASYTTFTNQAGGSQGNLGAPNYTAYYLWNCQFQPGQLNGNYSEVGVGWFEGSEISANHRVYSRALILDGGGNPTTITVLSNEYLTVYYELRLQLPLTDSTGSVTIDGVGTFNYTRRSQNIQTTNSPMTRICPCSTQFGGFNNYFMCSPNSLAAITSGPASYTGYTTNASTAAYVNNSYENTQTGTFPLSPALNNIRTFGSNLTCNGYLFYELDSAFTKLSTQILTITLKTNFARA